MKRIWAVVLSLLIPVAFSGGYLLATDNAFTTCTLQVPEGQRGVAPVCADISSTGVTTGLTAGIFGLLVWALIWGLAGFRVSRLEAS